MPAFPLCSPPSLKVHHDLLQPISLFVSEGAPRVETSASWFCMCMAAAVGCVDAGLCAMFSAVTGCASNGHCTAIDLHSKPRN